MVIVLLLMLFYFPSNIGFVRSLIKISLVLASNKSWSYYQHKILIAPLGWERAAALVSWCVIMENVRQSSRRQPTCLAANFAQIAATEAGLTALADLVLLPWVQGNRSTSLPRHRVARGCKYFVAFCYHLLIASPQPLLRIENQYLDN